MTCMSVGTLAENLSFLSKYADFEARIRFGIGFDFFRSKKRDIACCEFEPSCC